jgi:DNA-binding XRE family transcriptional regulator
VQESSRGFWTAETAAYFGRAVGDCPQALDVRAEGDQVFADDPDESEKFATSDNPATWSSLDERLAQTAWLGQTSPTTRQPVAHEVPPVAEGSNRFPLRASVAARNASRPMNSAPPEMDEQSIDPQDVPWLGDDDATRLEKARTVRGLSVEALAQRSGVPRRTINGVENHKHTPTVRTLYRVAMVLGVAMEALIEQSWLA